MLMPNSNGENALNIGPKMLSDLQGFEWTTALDSGRAADRGHACARASGVDACAEYDSSVGA